MAPWLISLFPPHRVYVEPFGGAASVLLRKPRTYAEVYNDLDGEVVNLFRVARENGEQLCRALELTPFLEQEYRLSFEPADDPVEQARRTCIRSYMGFGSNSLNRRIRSGFRSCSNRLGSTPAHDWANYPPALRVTIERLRGVVIENRDACDVIERYDCNDALHYCDPPYVASTRSLRMNGNHGYAHEMSDDDHRALAACLRQVKGKVVFERLRV